MCQRSLSVLSVRKCALCFGMQITHSVGKNGNHVSDNLEVEEKHIRRLLETMRLYAEIA